ncbi:hypothetical protein FB45DRAFT_157695 [Roridomyces roridus]|uniref:Uncharacterized protein n=1 Tax=Roridomyces roridus TaxID=1738132 RepID=A0AAD7BFT3_9AGAR|nr:hypothetical protein FB45DRAFT_157695 [Roridomyces roridus]
MLFPVLSLVLVVFSLKANALAKPKGLSGTTCTEGYYFSTIAPVGCRVCPLDHWCSGAQSPQPCQSSTGHSSCDPIVESQYRAAGPIWTHEDAPFES